MKVRHAVAGFVLAGLLAAPLSAAAQRRVAERPAAPADPKTLVVVPEPGARSEWAGKHGRNVNRARRGGVDVLFLGDSLTEYWDKQGQDVWGERYESRKAANFGIAADKVENILWRVENGEMDGIAPKVVILLAGINNTWGAGNDQAPRIAGGVAQIVRAIRAKSPGSRVLLLGLFPGKGGTSPLARGINERLAKLDDGRNVRYLDIGPKLAGPDGKVSAEIMPDGLHLSARGYEIWAESMDPVLEEMLEQAARGGAAGAELDSIGKGE